MLVLLLQYLIFVLIIVVAVLLIPLYPDGPAFGWIALPALACVLLCCYRCLARRRLSVRASSYASTEASLKAPPISPDDVDDESLLRSRLLCWAEMAASLRDV